MGQGAWTNNDPTTLIIPSGATTGQSRVLIGAAIPAALTAFYAAQSFTVISAEVFFSTTDDTFMYIGFVTSGTTVSIAIGSSQGGNIQERFFFSGGSAVNFTNRLNYEDSTGSVLGGTWVGVNKVNGWGDSGGSFRLRYRLVASPGGCVQLVGRTIGGTATSGITIGTLPAAFAPLEQQQFPVTNNGSGNCVLGIVQTNGVISVNGTFGADLTFNVIFPIDTNF